MSSLLLPLLLPLLFISADLWVPSSACPTSQCPYTRFDSNSSSTFKTTSQNFGIQYGIGSVNGSYVTDTVTVAGASVQNQKFGLAVSTADILTQSTTVGGSGSDTPSVNASSSGVQANGILGLGYPQLTAGTNFGESPYNPFVFNLVEQKIISDSVFSVYMNNANKEGWVGEVIFGGTDSSKYSGDLTYLPVAQLTTSSSPLDSLFGGSSSSSSSNNGYYYWMVYGQGIAVSNPASSSVSANHTLSSVAPFIIDTGTTLTYLPTQIAEDVAVAIAGDNRVQLDSQSSTFVTDCSAANSNAALQLQMSPSGSVSDSPVTLTVPASELVIPLDALTIEDATVCMLGIAPLSTSSSSSSSMSSEMFLIGDSVLRSAYLVFDIGQNRIGFAAANGVGGSVNGVNGTSSSAAPTTLAGRGSSWAALTLAVAAASALF